MFKVRTGSIHATVRIVSKFSKKDNLLKITFSNAIFVANGIALNANSHIKTSIAKTGKIKAAHPRKKI